MVMLNPGDVIHERYRIKEQVNRGGQGEVYEAHDSRINCPVALKRLHRDDLHSVAAFEAEAQLLANLDHPNLPKVSDFFVIGDERFLVMQFIAGDDLSRQLNQRNAPFYYGEVYGWTDQLLDTLSYLHTRQPPVIHRDIKPANLKLNGSRIMLLDFGLAKAGHSIIGGLTYDYAAPEQVQGIGAEPRSDLYALAATLYHLLTGALPPPAEKRWQEVWAGRKDPLYLSLAQNRKIPEPLSEMLGKAMALDPQDRFESAVAMRDALRTVENRRPISAPRVPRKSSNESPQPNPQPNMLRTGVLLALIALVVIGGTFAWLVLRRPLTPIPLPVVAPDAIKSLAESIIYRPNQKIICGIHGDLPGFSAKNDQGRYVGLDADLCRAVALAIYGDSEKVDFRPGITNAFAAVRPGAHDPIDVAFATTTATLNRDLGERVSFGPTTFHDGQGLLLRASASITSTVSLRNKRIRVCVVDNSTSLLNLPDIAGQVGMNVNEVRTSSIDRAFTEYSANRCDAVTGARSELAASRFKLQLDPEVHVLLDDVLSREPMAPFFREDDTRWAEVIHWVVDCTIAAEELGVGRAYLDEGKLANETDPRIRRLFGVAQERWSANNPGLLHDACRRIVQELGNYEEIYRRNLVDTGILPEERGPNKPWNKGGVMVPSIFR